MRKHVTAFFAAFLITLIVGLGMFVIGGNAALNKNGIPVQNLPDSSAVSASGPTDQSRLDQFGSTIPAT
jgi:hypothetical protein